MSREDQIEIQNIAKEALKTDRSKEEIIETLHGAGIIDKNGKVNEPYSKVFSQK